jgi:hypothetical protein
MLVVNAGTALEPYVPPPPPVVEAKEEAAALPPVNPSELLCAFYVLRVCIDLMLRLRCFSSCCGKCEGRGGGAAPCQPQ